MNNYKFLYINTGQREIKVENYFNIIFTLTINIIIALGKYKGEIKV